eukprot:5543575-Pyramimonas_sp.AAC.1
MADSAAPNSLNGSAHIPKPSCILRDSSPPCFLNKRMTMIRLRRARATMKTRRTERRGRGEGEGE